MVHGNQRELACQKNMQKTQEISKGKRKEDRVTTSEKKQRDSEIMQQRQKAANKTFLQTRVYVEKDGEQIILQKYKEYKEALFGFERLYVSTAKAKEEEMKYYDQKVTELKGFFP
ncbi:PREDICTED: small EDRK-rich factor 1-like [Elephantulus edwardii]|uniref:small EDRK-rich factor 1-like n=1 Tax=Elephantulus edwardii TaxID=28737 RepID=UPI0003F084C4|nr:PREDICTED: small EDRK-rich factor 1-like [Elephantulus edwardii]